MYQGRVRCCRHMKIIDFSHISSKPFQTMNAKRRQKKLTRAQPLRSRPISKRSWGGVFMQTHVPELIGKGEARKHV
ncbi:hypothetical protein CEXT_135701 [Caerostris extrusa]|uniref:Uncharacterized protein n=1 Tax=Caerostris extrusa TaxID=172846 RepID=A0AAV4M8Y9_CAEEX|nr:hypothetical protein CEXT_135701 [Caerostris extrusa]